MYAEASLALKGRRPVLGGRACDRRFLTHVTVASSGVVGVVWCACPVPGELPCRSSLCRCISPPDNGDPAPSACARSEKRREGERERCEPLRDEHTQTAPQRATSTRAKRPHHRQQRHLTPAMTSQEPLYQASPPHTLASPPSELAMPSMPASPAPKATSATAASSSILARGPTQTRRQQAAHRARILAVSGWRRRAKTAH